MGHVLRDWLMTLCIRLRDFFLSKRIFEDKSGKAVSGFVELALLCCNNLLCLIKSLHTLRLVAIVLNSNYLAVNSVLQVTYVTWACSLRVITLEWVLKFSCSLRIYTYLNLFKIKLDQQHFLLSAPQLCVLVIKSHIAKSGLSNGAKCRENTTNCTQNAALSFVGNFTWDTSKGLPSVVYG